MEDEQIISLYLQRDERAIRETEGKYGKSLLLLSKRIVSDEEDSKECVNDTYLRAWNAIPPTVPTHFSAYLSRIVRSVSIDRFRAKKSQRRSANEYTQSLDELNECIAGHETPQDALEIKHLTQVISDYLRSLPKEQRQVFLCRYYFLDPIKRIAQNFHISEAKTKSMLYRLRLGLKEHLEQEGYFL